MSTTTERLKGVDQNTKLLAFGYFHELVSSTRLTPDDIIHICILYLYEYDQFDSDFHGTRMKISTKGTDFKTNNVATVTEIEPESFGLSLWECIYGEYKIDCNKQNKGVFEWIFGINARSVSIGIRSIEDDNRVCDM